MKSLVKFLSVLLVVCLISPVGALAQGTETPVEEDTQHELGEMFSYERYAPFSLFSTQFKIVLMVQKAYVSGRNITADMTVSFSSKAQAVTVQSLLQRYDQVQGKWVDETVQLSLNNSCISYSPRVTYTVSVPGKYRVIQLAAAFSGTTTSTHQMISNECTIY